jgi:hypothetical protein
MANIWKKREEEEARRAQEEAKADELAELILEATETLEEPWRPQVAPEEPHYEWD